MEAIYRKIAKAFWALTAISIAWLLAQRFWLFGISSNFQTAFITIFCWGIAMIFDFLSKEEMLVMYSFVPAGDYKDGKRLMGLFIGVGNVCVALYGYFAGWSM